MAITGDQLNTAMGYDGKTPKERVLRELPPYGGTLQHWLIHGGQPYHGKVRRISTTAAGNAAAQATEVFTELNKMGVAP